MVGNKIPQISSLFKKTNYDTKINALEKKLLIIIMISILLIMAASAFNVRLVQVNLITKTYLDPKLSSLHKKNYCKQIKTFIS